MLVWCLMMDMVTSGTSLRLDPEIRIACCNSDAKPCRANIGQGVAEPWILHQADIEGCQAGYSPGYEVEDYDCVGDFSAAL